MRPLKNLVNDAARSPRSPNIPSRFGSLHLERAANEFLGSGLVARFTTRGIGLRVALP